jgi:hypothetical protein
MGGGETFCLIDYPDDCKLFSEYFISIKELRKLKLKQLNESSRIFSMQKRI